MHPILESLILIAYQRLRIGNDERNLFHLAHMGINRSDMHSDLNEQLVRLACPSSEEFKAIIAKGADFNQLDPSSEDTPFNDILISICAGDLLGECIKAGASVNPITTKGTTPLIQAIMAQDYRSVVILLEEGADPNIAGFTDEDQQTPLDFVYNEFYCIRRPADEKVCQAMEIVLREFGGKTYSELKDEAERASAANPCASGTSDISSTDQDRMPETTRNT